MSSVDLGKSKVAARRLGLLHKGRRELKEHGRL